LLARAARHVDAFIAMSDFSRDKHREFGFGREMEVVPSFVPDFMPDGTPSPFPASTGMLSPHARPYFLFVGRLETIKGLHTIIPVFRDYSAADLLVAGEGSQSEELRRLAAGNHRVHFLGRISNTELTRYYRHAVALIAPSLGFETFGIILIEAFAQSTPVIAHRIGAFPEIVTLARAGELYSTRDELEGAMRRLQEEPVYRARVAGNAYEAYRTHWTESAVLPRYLAVVRQAAARRGLRHITEALAGEHSDVQ
jgi:glycosyltransferase involved in cell wall biosynthesis